MRVKKWSIVVGSAVALAIVAFAPAAARRAIVCRDRVLANVTRVHMERAGALCREDPDAIGLAKMRGILWNGWGERIYLFRDQDGITLVSFAGHGKEHLRGRPRRQEIVDGAEFVWRDGRWIRDLI